MQGHNQTERGLYQFEYDCDFCISCFPRSFSPKLFIYISYSMLFKKLEHLWPRCSILRVDFKWKHRKYCRV